MKITKIIIAIILVIVLILSSPFFQTIFSSLLIAYLIYPLKNKINKLVKNDNLSSLILTIFSLIIFSAFLYLFTRAIIVTLIQAQSLIDVNIIYLNNFLSNQGNAIFLQAKPSNLVNIFQKMFLSTPKIFLDTLLMLFLVFYLIRDFSKLLYLFKRKLNKTNLKKTNFFIKRTQYILSNLLCQYFLLGIIMGLIIFLSLSFLGIKYSIELATIALIMSVFPVISGWMLVTGLSVYYFVTNNLLNAIVLAIVSLLLFFVHYYFDKIFENKKGINQLMLLLGLVSGLYSMGLFGFIAGPILAGIIQAVYETIFYQS